MWPPACEGIPSARGSRIRPALRQWLVPAFTFDSTAAGTVDFWPRNPIADQAVRSGRACCGRSAFCAGRFGGSAPWSARQGSRSASVSLLFPGFQQQNGTLAVRTVALFWLRQITADLPSVLATEAAACQRTYRSVAATGVCSGANTDATGIAAATCRITQSQTLSAQLRHIRLVTSST
jgi:hypothetical protein